MSRLIIASGNAGKLREIREILGGLYDEIITMREAGVQGEAVECGETFEQNAYLKACYVHERVEGDVLADDSGLCVDALGGHPGVFSARYSQSGTDDDNNAKLIAELSAVPQGQRGAHYVCHICLIKRSGKRLDTEGVCEGEICTSALGTGGFGYDPYFYLPQYSKTMAELSSEEKNSISHRRLALNGIFDRLSRGK